MNDSKSTKNDIGEITAKAINYATRYDRAMQ